MKRSLACVAAVALAVAGSAGCERRWTTPVADAGLIEDAGEPRDAARKHSLEGTTLPDSGLSANVILPLGDSWTSGIDKSVTWRYLLQKKLQRSGIHHTFVGSLSKTGGGPGDYAAEVAEDETFQPSHEGHFGWWIRQIDQGLDQYFAHYVAVPTIVLVNAGSNDVENGVGAAMAANSLTKLVDHVSERAPNAKIYVSRMLPNAHPSIAALSAFRDALISFPSTVKKPALVTMVDHWEGFVAEIGADLAPDGEHHSLSGEKKIAALNYSALLPELADVWVAWPLEERTVTADEPIVIAAREGRGFQQVDLLARAVTTSGVESEWTKMGSCSATPCSVAWPSSALGAYEARPVATRDGVAVEGPISTFGAVTPLPPVTASASQPGAVQDTWSSVPPVETKDTFDFESTPSTTAIVSGLTVGAGGGGGGGNGGDGGAEIRFAARARGYLAVNAGGIMRLLLACPQADAELRVDGRARASCTSRGYEVAVDLPLNPGMHEFELRALYASPGGRASVRYHPRGEAVRDSVGPLLH